MYIQINTITQDKQWRDFRLHIADFDLELALELVRKIARQHEMVSVSYFDQKGELPIALETIRLPVFLNPISQLRQQWESILAPLAASESNKVVPSSQQNEHLAVVRQRWLNHLQQVLMQMQQLLEATQTNLTDGPRKERLLALHQQTIQRCQQSIAQLRAFSKSADY